MDLMVPGAPFSISADAALWVVEQLRAADAHPDAAGLVPALSQAFNSTVGDGRGGILEHVPCPHYLIGWYRAEGANAESGVWVELFDRKFFLHNATLEELRGTQLRLQRVESALASQLGIPRYVLRAGAVGKGIFKYSDE